MVTFEPREDYVRLGAVEVQLLAVEMSMLARLCAFLQQKSDEFTETRGANPAYITVAFACSPVGYHLGYGQASFAGQVAARVRVDGARGPGT